MSQRVCAAVPVMVWRKTTIGASGGRAWHASSLAHSTVTSGSSLQALKRGAAPPLSGGSTFRRSSPRRERAKASAKLALEFLAQVVGS